MNLKICAVGLVATLVAHSALSAAYTTYTWQAVDGSYDGLFTDSTHWTPAIEGYPGSSLDNMNQLATVPAIADTEFTIGFPSGSYDNISSFQSKIRTGQTIWLSGESTTWNMPALTDGTAKRNYFNFYLDDGSGGNTRYLFKYQTEDTVDRGCFKNFKICHSSSSESGTRLDIYKGEISWTQAAAQLFADTKGGDTHGIAEICFRPGTEFTFGGAYIGSSSLTNRLVFLGGTHSLGNMRQQYNVGNKPGFAEIDIVAKGGAVVKASNLTLGYSSTSASYGTSADKIFRVDVSEGASFEPTKFDFSAPGRLFVDVRGEGSQLKLSSNCYAGDAANSKVRVSVTDGAAFAVSYTPYFGASKSASLEGNDVMLGVTNATLNLNNGGQPLTMYSGDLSIVDSYVTIGTAICANRTAGSDPSCYLSGVTTEISTTDASGFIYNFSTVKLGTGGFTAYSVHPLQAYSVTQRFTDAPGEEGRLSFASQYPNLAYTLKDSASDESYLVASKAVVKMAVGANHYSHVVVTNGSTFTTQGGAMSLTLRGLTLGNAVSAGTLALDVGDAIRIEGPVSLVNGVITYSSELPVGTHTVFTSTAATAEEIENWLLGVGFRIDGLPEGMFLNYATAEGEGVTSFQVVVRETLPDLDDNLRLTLDGSEAKDVVLDGEKDVGTISFTAGGYTISGGSLVFVRTTQGGLIDSQVGENVIASPLWLTDFGPDPITVHVSEGSTLTIAGRILGGGIIKTGAGKLILSNAGNRMPAGVVVNGGTVSASDPLALGGSAQSDNHSKLADGTLEIAGNESNGVPGSPLDIESSVSETKAVVVKADVDATLRLGGDGETGASLFKRGEGALAFQVDGDLTLNVKSDHATSLTKDTVLEFPASGEGPDVPRGSINVTEGELAFRAGKGNPKLTVPGKAANGDARQCLYLTYPYADAAADPKFVLDGVGLESTGHATHFANCLTAANSPKVHPELHVTNGAYMSVWMFSASESSNKAGLDSKAVFDNGALYTQAFYANAGGTIVVTNHYEFRNGSGLYVTAQNQFQGPLVMVFDRSKYARNAQGDVADTLALSKEFNTTTIGKIISLSFANGSLFAVGAINRNSGTASALAEVSFDDSEWFCGDADKTIPSTTMNVVTTAGEGGLVMAPPAGRTWTWVGPLEGEGGLVKKGAGTVLFGRRIYLGKEHEDPATLKCMGVNDVQSGTFALAEGAVGAAGAKFHVAEEALLDLGGVEQSGLTVSGNGTVANGTLTRASVAVDSNAAEAPLLDFANGLDVSGRMTLDFGEVSEQVLSSEVAVARYTGTLPTGLSFRVKGRTADGKPVSGTVRVADGVIYATPQVRGLMILVR